MFDKMHDKTPSSLDIHLQRKISNRKETDNYRQLKKSENLIDFSSNDYLGFAKSRDLYLKIKQSEEEFSLMVLPGAGASRLITGNYPLYDIAEEKLSRFYKSEKVLIFNSGYDANVGLFSCLCDRNDTILYDEYVHASIRDGIRISNARSYSFRHNDLNNLKQKLSYVRKQGHANGNIIVAVESVYSMEGVKKNQSGKYFLEEIINFCHENGIYIIVDEAHATGVYGKSGEGLVIQCGLQNKVFARVHTFGKALGVHGAAITCSELLYNYLVNFARSFIYTTALPPHSLVSIVVAHEFLSSSKSLMNQLNENINYFNKMYHNNLLNNEGNDSAIHAIAAPGIENAKKLAQKCQSAGFDVRAILSPTVPPGKEILRVCLHAFNTISEIDGLLNVIHRFHQNNIPGSKLIL